MNLLDVGYFKTEENVNTDSEIIVAALQLPSFRVHFVLPLYQLLNIFKAIQVYTFLYLLSYCIVFSAPLVWMTNIPTPPTCFSPCACEYPKWIIFFHNCKLLRKNSFIDFNLIFSIWCDILKNYRCNCNVTLTAYPIYFHFSIFSSIQCQDSIVCA